MIEKLSSYLVSALITLILIFIVCWHFPPFRRKFTKPPSAGIEARPLKSVAACSLVLGSSVANGSCEKPRKTFGFSERIYALADVKNISAGNHSVCFLWINPRGGLQETFQKDFNSPGGIYRGWSWIKLEGDLLPLSVGPLGGGKFIGKWRVQVYLDGEFLSETSFEVQ